jgi:hypothetical protein
MAPPAASPAARSVLYERFVGMIKEVFDNSLPVFVAAMVSRASSSLIALSSENLTVLIWVQFVYAFFIAQFVGILVAAQMTPSYISFNYFMNLCSDCTSFAWKEFVVLIMLKWLFVNKNIAVACGAWLLLVFCAFVGVYVFNAILSTRCHHLGSHVYSNLRKFNTDSFSLAIAFSFTLVVASEIYPSHMSQDLAGTDDIVENPEEAVDDDSGGYYFVLYAIFITVAISFMQWKWGWVADRQELFDADENAELSGGHTSRMYHPVSVHVGEEGEFDADTNDVILETGDNPINVAPARSAMNIVSSPSASMTRSSGSAILQNYSIRPQHSTSDSRTVFNTCNTCWSYVDNVIFAWDPRGRVKQSLMHMLNTVSGYIVGCAWYTFSVMTFQNWFISIRAGEVLGRFLFSFLTTCSVVLIMVCIERGNKKQLDGRLKGVGSNSRMLTQDVLEKIAARYKRGNDLVLVAGRILIGWSWSDFVSSCFGVMLADQELENKASNWFGAISKCIIAAVCVFVGKIVDAYLTRRRVNGAEETAREIASFSNRAPSVPPISGAGSTGKPAGSEVSGIHGQASSSSVVRQASSSSLNTSWTEILEGEDEVVI